MLTISKIFSFFLIYTGCRPFLDDLEKSWVTDTIGSCYSNGLNLTHGMVIYVTVKCVNVVELATAISSDPFYISLEKPITRNAYVEFTPLSMNSTQDFFPDVAPSANIQSNQTCVQFHWHGFEDASPIMRYDFELFDITNNTIMDWTYVGNRTAVSKCGLGLSSADSVIARVRATNSGSHESDPISTPIIISATSPRLSGMICLLKYYIHYIGYF